MTRVAYVGGFWAPNIGNAFFNFGAQYVLEQMFGKENVYMVFDHPAHITQWNTNKGNPPKAYNNIMDLDVDYVVMLGPVLSRSFLNTWKDTILELEARGVKYMVLSAGIMKASNGDLEEIRDFFKEHPPYVMTTRDSETYEFFHEYAEHSYDGVCFAFYTPDYYKPAPYVNNDFVVLNFDKVDEPWITVDDVEKEGAVPFGQKYWTLDFKKSLLAKVGLKTDRFTDALVYLHSLLPAGKRPDTIDGHRVIRTDHRFSPMVMSKVYRYNNSFCSDIPHTYLDIYSRSFITFSDRVHACAVTLAYGGYAMLFAKTNRSGLLDRVGAQHISEKPVCVDMDYLRNEKNKMLEWLKSIEY